MRRDDLTIYGICRSRDCSYVWTEEPQPRGNQTTAPTCPSCGLKAWPMFPGEASARRHQYGHGRCASCGGAMMVCRVCSEGQAEDILMCEKCGVHSG
jgi:hypothetical protein